MSEKNQDPKNLPTLRFQEFEEEWEKKKFGKLASNKTGKYNPEYETEFIKCIELEHLATNNGQLLGYIDGSKAGSIKNTFEEGDVLFGKLRPYLKKYLQAPFKGVCSSEIWVLKGINITNDFVYRIVQTNKFIDLANQTSGSKMPRADWSVVENCEFSFPSLSEQTKIASFLSAVDEKLQALKKKKSLLEDYKKGVMQKIFSKELRFKDENGKIFPDWQQKKLGEITFKVDKKNKGNEKLPIYSISNVNGFVPQSEQFEGMDSNERGYDISIYKIIEKNTYAYNPARINVGSIGYSGNLDKVIVSSLYVCFKTKETISDDFFNCFLKTKHFNDSVLKKGEGGVRIYLFYENFSQISISFPSLSEQTKIAKFLGSLDEKITHTQTQMEKTETWKKGLLQKMFV